MTSIHLSNIFGLPSGVEKIAYWRVFGQKLVSSCTAGMFSWEQAQSFHIIGGIPIQANGMQFLARIPNVPDDEELLPSLTAGVWIFSNGLGSVGNNGELASASPVEKRHLQLVLEPKCPDLSGIHSLRKADLLLPSGRITVYIEDSNEYDLICWKTDMLERTPDQYRRIEGDQIFVDKSTILNACLYGTG